MVGPGLAREGPGLPLGSLLPQVMIQDRWLAPEFLGVEHSGLGQVLFFYQAALTFLPHDYFVPSK